MAAPSAKTQRNRKSKPPRLNAAGQVTDRVAEILNRELPLIGNKLFRRPAKCRIEDEPQLVQEVELGRPTGFSSEASSLPPHLARMSTTPLLKPEEETALFRRMNFCKHMANVVRSSLSDADDQQGAIAEYDSWIARSQRLRNYIIQANTRLVMSIARKFADDRNSFDELLSSGIASLMHAIEKFDYDRGFRFSTYATCAVRRDLYRNVMIAKRDLSRLGARNNEGLDALPTDETVDQRLDEPNWRRLSEALQGMLASLDQRERTILQKRYGLDGSTKRMSYSNLGIELGISKERVRQIANRAMEQLRVVAGELRLEAFLD